MDPLSQAVLGASLPQAVSRNKSQLAIIFVIGAVSGMAADLDFFIRSSTDSLLFLDYHRQFTHSLVFVPIGALLCSIGLFFIFKAKLSFAKIYTYSFLGYLTHALLDSCTSYGTQLLWPFSSQRIAWNNVSIIDPLFTIPLLIFTLLAAFKKKKLYAQIGLVYALTYLCFGALQADRVRAVGRDLAISRGHTPEEIIAKPSLGNLVLWKLIYEYKNTYYVDAVRMAVGSKVISGGFIKKLDLQKDFPQVKKGSVLHKDILRFTEFSMGYVAKNPSDAFSIVDIRYSHVPNQIKALWGIKFDPTQANTRATYVNFKQDRKKNIKVFLNLLLGL